MQPCLIVDVRERALFALLLGSDGRAVPFSHKVGGGATRYLSTEIWLDPDVSGREGARLAEFHEALVHAARAAAAVDGRERGARGALRRAAWAPEALSWGRPLGLLRPWDLGSHIGAVLLRSPLQVLSHPEALARPAQARWLAEVSLALLSACFAPLFRFVAQAGAAPRHVDAALVVAARTGWRARQLLRRLFHLQGFRRVAFLDREAAAALALVGSDPGPLAVLDLADDALQVHRVEVETLGERALVTAGATRSLRACGWSSIVRKLAKTLMPGEDGLDQGSAHAAAVDRALIGLVGGPHRAELPGNPPVRVTYQLVDEALAGLGQDLCKELERNLQPAMAELGIENGPRLLVGSGFLVAGLEALVLSACGGFQSAPARRWSASERIVRAVAHGVCWLEGGRSRALEVDNHGSLRVDTLRGSSLELFRLADLPRRPGDSRVLGQMLRLEGDRNGAGSLLVNLVCGCDPDPDFDAALCVIPVELASGMPEVRLDLGVRRSRGGGRLAGWAEVALGDRRERRRLEFTTAGPLLWTSADRSAALEAETSVDGGEESRTVGSGSG